VALSVFDDKSRPPADDDLAAMLGKTYPYWNQLKTAVAARCSPASSVWGFAGKNFGWSMRLKSKDRTILYMTPCRGWFLVSFALGERAVKAARDSRLPASVLTAIDGAKRYAEGRGVRFEVRDACTVRHMDTLAGIKIAN
jgi:hypothetical protein